MAFTRLTSDLAIIAALADLPNSTSGLTPAQLKAKFDEAAGLIKAYLNNTLAAELEAITDGDSGADNIGATAISGLTGTTVQALIESVKTYADNLSIGAIPDGSLAEAKLITALANKINTAYPTGQYAADAGSTDSYAITLSPAPSSYFVGMVVRFKANTLNTGPTSLNVNGLGAVNLVKSFNVALETGDILANQIVEVIYDGTNFQLIGGKLVPRVRVNNSSAQSIVSGTLTALNFNSETYDTDSIHDNITNPSRLTCKTAGVYHIIATVTFAGNATGYRRATLIFNGSDIVSDVLIPAVNGAQTSIVVTGDYLLAANDYVEVKAQQTSGGALDVNGGSGTTFSMRRVS